jgi:hypothetical protein
MLSFTGKCMELENIMVREVSGFRKTKVTCFPSYWKTDANTNVSIIHVCVCVCVCVCGFQKWDG